MINELKLIDSIAILSDARIILYGAGYQGVATLKKLRVAGFRPAYFCDGDSRKWGSFIDGLEVLSLLELKQLDEVEKLAIIITTDQVHFIDQIADDIAWLKLKTDKIFTMFGLDVSLVYNNKISRLYGGRYNAILDMHRDAFWASWMILCMEMFASWVEKDNITLVYSCSKTGTSSIVRSLAEIRIAAAHIHELAYERIGNFKPPMVEAVMANHRQEISKILKSRKSVKIISLMREPIGRALSHIFYLIGHFEFKLRDIPAGKSFVSSVAELMTFRNGEIYDPKHEILNWFDTELKAMFGVDVYNCSFDKEKGYSIIKQSNVEVLLIKLEKLKYLESVIAEFIGVRSFKLINENEAIEKPYKYLYRQVKDAIKLPCGVFDHYYENPRMAHFYTEDEIAGFMKKWENNIAV